MPPKKGKIVCWSFEKLLKLSWKKTLCWFFWKTLEIPKKKIFRWLIVWKTLEVANKKLLLIVWKSLEVPKKKAYVNCLKFGHDIVKSSSWCILAFCYCPSHPEILVETSTLQIMEKGIGFWFSPCLEVPSDPLNLMIRKRQIPLNKMDHWWWSHQLGRS